MFLRQVVGAFQHQGHLGAERLLGLFSLHAPQQGIGVGSSLFHHMCVIGDTEFSADWNVRISLEEMPESVNERSCSSYDTPNTADRWFRE